MKASTIQSTELSKFHTWASDDFLIYCPDLQLMVPATRRIPEASTLALATRT